MVRRAGNQRADKSTLDDPLDPSEETLEWCRGLVNMLADGAVWGIPRSGAMFRVNKQAQTLTLIPIEGTSDAAQGDFEATKLVFAKIGWRVIDSSERVS